jgi:hypothetical protein
MGSGHDFSCAQRGLLGIGLSAAARGGVSQLCTSSRPAGTVADQETSAGSTCTTLRVIRGWQSSPNPPKPGP